MVQSTQGTTRPLPGSPNKATTSSAVRPGRSFDLTSSSDGNALTNEHHPKRKTARNKNRFTNSTVVILSNRTSPENTVGEVHKGVQEKYQYDPEKAEEFRFRLDAAKDAAAEEVAVEKQRQQRQLGHNARTQQRAKAESEKTAALSLEAHEIGTGDGTYN